MSYRSMTSLFPPFAFDELVSRVAFVVSNKSMASRFVSISDEEVKECTEKLENENAKKKTMYDIKIFKEYLDGCDEKREIEDITPVELQEIIKKIVLAMRKKNGEE